MAKNVGLNHVGAFSFNFSELDIGLQSILAVKILGGVMSGSDFLTMSDQNARTSCSLAGWDSYLLANLRYSCSESRQ